MTLTHIKTCLILVAFGVSIAAAQSPAKDPNATPAAKADPGQTPGDTAGRFGR